MGDAKQHNNWEFTVTQITTANVKKYYNDKFVYGMSTETLTRHRTILKGSFDYAIEVLDMLEVNPADRASLPKSTMKRTPTYYDVEQLKTLFQEVEGESIEATVRISATYGLRRSEVLGLKWSAIDFERKTLTISHTVVRGGLIVVADDTVKENASFRTMPLIKDIEAFLLQLKKKQEEYKKLCGKSYHKGDYICVWEDGKPIDPAYVTSRFRRFLKAKGLPLIRFHDLRHSSASLLVNNGFTLEEVMKWLGHASIRSTERYAHLQKHDKEDMANTVDGLLSL